jgi:hypothetical protein
VTPLLARALVAAAAPPDDYESVVGDLHEEYEMRLSEHGRRSADRWYWSQALRSMPPLLTYSRSRNSFIATALATLAVLAILALMLICNEMIDDGLAAIIPSIQHAHDGIRAWPFFAVGWSVAAVFGAILVAIFRSRPFRLPLAASLMLIAAIAVPIALGISSHLSVLTWMLVLGSMPAMVGGAAMYQTLRR